MDLQRWVLRSETQPAPDTTWCTVLAACKLSLDGIEDQLHHLVKTSQRNSSKDQSYQQWEKCKWVGCGGGNAKPSLNHHAQAVADTTLQCWAVQTQAAQEVGPELDNPIHRSKPQPPWPTSDAQSGVRGSLPAALQQLLPQHAATLAAPSWHAAYCWWRFLLHQGWADSTAKSSGSETTSEPHKN